MYYTGIFPKLSSAALVPLFLPKSRYYMVIFPKLSSATLVPLFQPKSRYYMIIFPNYHQPPWITLVPLMKPTMMAPIVI